MEIEIIDMILIPLSFINHDKFAIIIFITISTLNEITKLYKIWKRHY